MHMCIKDIKKSQHNISASLKELIESRKVDLQLFFFLPTLLFGTLTVYIIPFHLRADPMRISFVPYKIILKLCLWILVNNWKKPCPVWIGTSRHPRWTYGLCFYFNFATDFLELLSYSYYLDVRKYKAYEMDLSLPPLAKCFSFSTYSKLI